MIYLLLAIISFVIVLQVYVLYAKGIRSVFDPLFVFTITYMLFYTLDNLFHLVDSIDNQYFFLSAKLFIYEDNGLAVLTLFFLAVYLAWLFGDLVCTKISKYSSKKRSNVSLPVSYITIVFSYVLSSLALLFLISRILSYSSLADYFANMSVRAIIFGETTLLNAIFHVVFIFSIIVGSFALYSKGKYKRNLGIGLLMLSFAYSIFSGARALVVKDAFIILFIRNFFVHKVVFTIRNLFYFFGLILTLVYIVFLTRITAESGATINLFSMIFDTGQVPQANNFLIIFQEQLTTNYFGETLVNALLSMFPSNFLALFGIEKELGANELFTNYFWPERQTQVSVGGVNDIYLNFGFFGTLIFYFLLGFIYRYIYLLLINTNSRYMLLLYAPFLWSIFQQLRGDYFHTINKLILFFVALSLFYLIQSFRSLKR